MVPLAQLFKNRLQEYAQHNSLPLPIYDTVNEGESHQPQFKSTVTINGTKYESPSGFNNKKAAQIAAAKVAVEDLSRQGLLRQCEEKVRPKNVLAELALRKSMPPPTYHLTRTFTATVKINGASYTGGPANNPREAANKAALEAILAIDPQFCNSLPLVQRNANNNSEHPTAECNNGSKHPNANCNVSNSESKMPADNLTSNNKLPGGTESQSAENGLEKLNSDDAPALEKGSEKTDVVSPLKKETGDVYQDKQHGSMDIEGKQQSNQEVLTESISKRSRTESENAAQMSPRNKKHKMKKSAGTA